MTTITEQQNNLGFGIDDHQPILVKKDHLKPKIQGAFSEIKKSDSKDFKSSDAQLNMGETIMSKKSELTDLTEGHESEEEEDYNSGSEKTEIVKDEI